MNGATWMVKTTHPGFTACSTASVAAVNFFVREPVEMFTLDELRRRLSGTRSARFAKQLHRFAHEIEVGDRVVTKVATVWHAGTVTGPYRYDEHTIVDHPHVRDVTWDPEPVDPETAAAIQVARRSPYSTVEHLDLATSMPPRHEAAAPVPIAATLAIQGAELRPLPGSGGSVQPCPFGRCTAHSDYRYRWPQDLPGSGQRMLFVLKNPSCPDTLDNKTFQGVLGLARRENASSLEVVNLFARRTGSDASLLNQISYAEAVGPENDAAIAEAAAASDVIVAAWGGSDGVRTTTYRRRVAEVLHLLRDRDLQAIARSKTAPVHPMVWSSADVLRAWRPAGSGSTSG